ncbi:low-density lipoprotein receptor-related protein 1-like isoform X2 [Mya arenaria]|uniref:low-density lipoprotein receptor-related protein 1-like isoform X2 n=1 Tax=Mya arenaria TaxID=6604 RepID=UPI0022E3661B|nr:low-density lipoprotein receptor-related protein 1-like isoform X2 [Mya arenaria]
MIRLFWKFLPSFGVYLSLLSSIPIHASLGDIELDLIHYDEWIAPQYTCPIGSDFTWPCSSTAGVGRDLQCIHKDWLCDLDPDCPNGEDEDTGPTGPCRDTHSKLCGEEDHFVCADDKSLCIPRNWMCDGDLDCDDGSDENKDNCRTHGIDRPGPHVKNLIPCTPNQFQCGGSHKCIPLSNVCDTEHDCDSGSDEYGCANNKCDEKPCGDANCAETVDGALCYCDSGLAWNNTSKTCEDLNECKYEQFCDQPEYCENTNGSYTCKCATGFASKENSRCRADNEGREPTILISNTWDIQQLTLAGAPYTKSPMRWLKQAQKAETLDFNYANKEVCWLTYRGNQGHTELICASSELPDLKGPSKIKVPILLTTVVDFAIDWITENLYFLDLELSRLSVCDPNKSLCAALVAGTGAPVTMATLEGPRSIALCPTGGYLFFSDWSKANSTIYRLNMDGTSLTSAVTTKLAKPIGLTLDHTNNHLYWADMELNVVERINYDGDDSSRRVITIGMKVEYIYSLSVFENYMYMSDRHDNQVIKVHRYDYGVPAVTLNANMSRPARLHMFHKVKQPKVPNPCESMQCDHICALTRIDEKLNATCLCPAGYMQSDKGCTEVGNCPANCEDNSCSIVSSNCSLEVCPENKSYCTATHECMPQDWWCDSKVDCPSSDDEGLYCKYDECTIHTFQCTTTGKCISVELRCDSHVDCTEGEHFDNSDENGCEGGCAAMNMFDCNSTSVNMNKSSQCVPKSYVCDGHADCEQGEDEKNCAGVPIFQCSNVTEFTCRKGGECISIGWLCDGEEDCADGSDEDVGTCQKAQCIQGETVCKTGNQCIPDNWFCDDEPDCNDKSDEDTALCSHIVCKEPNYKCMNSTGKMICVPAGNVCDGTLQCSPDWSDEGGLCSENHCSSNPCTTSKCYNMPYGYSCECPPGQKFNQIAGKCIVTNPCLQWGTCSQGCNLDPSVDIGYRCTCFDGFFLKSDKFTCKPLESDPVYVVFSNRHEIRRVDTATSNAVSLKSGLRNTIALDFYYNSEGYAVLFWSDVMEDKIYKGVMQGNELINVVPIVTSGLATTEGVAVDWIGENIYWVESTLDQIEVAKLDGSFRTTLIAGNMASPRAIAVDPTVGKLFWTDWEGTNPRIEMCSMSGNESTRKTIYQILPSTGGGWPNGLTLDYDSKRIYWIDARSESIHTLTYEGTDHRLVLKNQPEMRHPFSIALFGTEVYWTDWSSNAVVMANKFNGSNIRVVQKTITQPFDLQVIHPKRQPTVNVTNPCAVNNGGCSDLCLIGLHGSVGCLCPHRKKLGHDNKTCVEDKQFLLFVKNQEIRGIDLNKGYFNVLPVISIPHVDTPTAIDYDVKQNYFYWADKGLNVINRANFDANVETLIDKGLTNPEGFAIDWLSGNMYFSSYDLTLKTASISVATLNGTFRTEIIKKNQISKPHSIALHPAKGIMFFTDVFEAEGNHVLWRAGMDGYEITQILKNLHNPSSLSIDTEQNRLYLINNKQIIWIDITTNGPQQSTTQINLMKQLSLPGDPEAITVHKDTIYVSSEGKIVALSKNGNNQSIVREATPNVQALIMFDVQTRFKQDKLNEPNECHGNHTCSQLCLPKSQLLSRCVCTAGFSLSVKDQSTCEGITSFLLYAKETEIRGVMFKSGDDQEALPPISQIQSLSAVDFHAEDDMIYWVDTQTNSISRIRRDLSHREVVITEGINSVEGLAVDWISRTLYWTDAGHSTIEMSKFNGSGRYVIASGDMEKPRSIVVHPVMGYVFWSDWGKDSRIERANLDGSRRVQYVYTNISQPWGLTIDYNTNMLYWCDIERGTIEKQDLLRGERKTLLSNIEPISLTIKDDRLYWIDKSDGYSIKSARKETGLDIQTVTSGLGPGLKDIKAFDQSRQTGTNPCHINNGGCENLCFYTSQKKVQCACSFGQLDPKTNKSCINYEQYLMFSKVTSIETIHLTDASNKNPPSQPIKDEDHLRNVIGLTFDYEGRRIFFSDIQRGDLQMSYFNGSNITTLVEGVGSVEGLAYIRNGSERFLYWTSYTNSCISRIDVDDSLKNTSRKPQVVVQLSKVDHPRAIAVDSCWQLVYWTNWNIEKPRIQRSNLEGLNSEDIITKDILTPNGLAIDHLAKKLYWSDARLDKIERCNMDGTEREIVITSIPQHSFGLVIYKDYIYWTDWMLRAVIRANKYDGTGIVWLQKNLDRQPMGIIAISEDSNNCTLNACHHDNYGCEDECHTDKFGEPFCQCRYGRLKSDGKTCASLIDCNNVGYTSFPCLTGVCLRFEKSCDGLIDCLDGSDEAVYVCSNRTCPPDFWTCTNRTQGQCIALSKKCDSVIDCHDASDENPEMCGCPEGSFTCKNHACIPKLLKCDGVGDCLDNSDEMDCVASPECEMGYFKCQMGGTCMPDFKKCDGHFDCQDNSDEDPAICGNKTSVCKAGLFRCDDGSCINDQWHCDRDEDCEDMSDEKNCEYQCEGQYACAGTNKICIEKSWKCDGNPDCPESDDEKDCENIQCDENHFLCGNGTGPCIDKLWVCDSEFDCLDGSDESPLQGCAPNACEMDEFQCANFRCVETVFYCDTDDDCGDMSDEPQGCVPRHTHCAESMIQCLNGSCLTREQLCKGFTCEEYVTDISGLTCAGVTCAEHQFQCLDGICIDESRVCNEIRDCFDGTDEDMSCNVDECQMFKPCSQICTDKKIGYECSCNQGYTLKTEGKTCQDVDECSTEFPCAHFCHNVPGTYYCTCAEGFSLEDDRRGCNYTNSSDPPYLLVSNRYYIQKVNLVPNADDSHNITIIQSNLSHSVAIDFDISEQMIYWTDIRSQSSTISRKKLDGNVTAEVLHSSTVLNPDGIAVDWIGRNLYWCDRNTDTIEVSLLDGRYRKVLLKDKTFLREPRALELFPKYGYLFISDWGEHPHISRLSMDGTQKQHIITNDIAWPNGLTIDYITEKIFWVDANYDYIAMADLDGQNRHRISDQSLPHPFAITTFVDKIYWSDWEYNAIYEARKFSGEKRRRIALLNQRPMDVVVYHALRQPQWYNPCKQLNCSHLCLLKPDGKNNVTATCACPENHKQEGNTCKSDCDSSQFLCANSSKCIPGWWQCDGSPDCEDQSDERLKGDVCPPYTCKQPGLFQCTRAVNGSNECFSPNYICDGTPQCTDGSDEKIYDCGTYPCIAGQFKCEEDGKCISSFRLCDGKQDCSDGADERNCTNQECLPTQYKCTNSRNCIPYLWQCDGDNDCSEGDDELDCSTRKCKDGYIKCAKTNKCIPKAWECDGEADCGPEDNTDENQCEKKTCEPNHFLCTNQHCIPQRWRCDDDNDCSDGSDEYNCTAKNCSDSEFLCPSGNRCIPNLAKCDGKADCSDGADESDDVCHATRPTCDPDQFICTTSRTCVPSSWRCDGERDCSDGSDEDKCHEHSVCKEWEYMCEADSKCIQLSWRCDGEPDCSDGKDEMDCDKVACPPFWFRCMDNTCLPPYKKCDGTKDCQVKDSTTKWHDEADSLCLIESCAPNQYRCANKRKCIYRSQVCDMRPDCDGGDDEIKCFINDRDKCPDDHKCQGSCIVNKTEQRIVCTCPPAYRVASDGVQCIPNDPCVRLDTCDQLCSTHHNVVKGQHEAEFGFKCWCESNFVEERRENSADNTTRVYCKSKGDLPKLLITAEENVYIQNPHSPQTRFKLSDDPTFKLGKIISLDVDATSENELLLLSLHRQDGVNKISRIVHKLNTKGNNNGKKKREADSNNKLPTLVQDMEDPQAIAVDWLGKNLYWTDISKATISMLHYGDGSASAKKVTIIDKGLNRPFGIAVDPVIGKIFFTDYGNPPKVFSANLDGTDMKVIVEDKLISPRGIVVDYHSMRVYFADSKLRTVEAIRYGGEDRTLVRSFQKPYAPYHLDVFEDYVYATMFNRSLPVIKFSKFNGSTEALHNLSNSIDTGDIVIQHRNKQILPDNATLSARALGKADHKICNSHPCGNQSLCVITPFKNPGYSCLCGDGATFNVTSKSCVYPKCPPDYCGRHGQCVITDNNSFECKCSLGFVGNHCEDDLCLDYCQANGNCSFTKARDGEIKKFCECPAMFSGDRCEIFDCYLQCLNGGQCTWNATLNKIHCRCREGFFGEKCENLTSTYCDNYCENGGTCGRDSRGLRFCSCTEDYAGPRCEQCGLQYSTTICANNGKCLIKNQVPYCQCQPGWNNKTNCEKQTCEGYCLNSGQCSLGEGQLLCHCSPVFTGQRCETPIDCKHHGCKNGGICDDQGNQVIQPQQCKCLPGYSGPFCEISSCNLQCKNGGNCTIESPGEPYCTCPQQFNGKTCDACRNPLVEGEKCNRSKCHDYCFNGGECEGCHLDPKLPAVAVCSQCKCQAPYCGARCQTKHCPSTQATFTAKVSVATILVPVVVVLCIVVAVILFIIIRRRRSQFGHSRLKDHTKMQVSNPIYMPQTTEEDDEDESHQPLDQPFDFDPEKSTNFANPVYEQFYDNSRQTLLPKNEDEDSDVEENKLNGQHSGLK